MELGSGILYYGAAGAGDEGSGLRHQGVLLLWVECAREKILEPVEGHLNQIISHHPPTHPGHRLLYNILTKHTFVYMRPSALQHPTLTASKDCFSTPTKAVRGAPSLTELYQSSLRKPPI